jgi:single-strand DNA-binding protein
MSVNKVILIGNVGKDPDVKFIESGIAVARFPLATTEVYYDRNNNNEKKEITEWHNIVLWRGLAETAQKYVKKGRQLYIEGRIQTRSYEKDGQKLYFTEIIANNMMFLGKKEEGQDAQPQSQPQPAAAAAPVANQTSPAASPVDNLIDSKPDGDLPF